MIIGLSGLLLFQQNQFNPVNPEIRQILIQTIALRGYSSSVVISPGSSPSSWALRRRRMILPERVLGSVGVNSISDGTAMGPSSRRTWSCRSLIMRSEPSLPMRNVTNPLITSPRNWSGLPMTAASATVSIDYATGLRAMPYCSGTVSIPKAVDQAIRWKPGCEPL